jgi:HK97 family phage prohead protease
MKKSKKTRKVTLSSPEQLKKYGFDEPFNYDFDFKAKASSKAKARKKKMQKRKGIKKKNAPAEPEEDMIIRGKASTNHKDRVDDVITPEALKGASSDLLQKGSNTVFFNHDTDFPIGKVNKSDFVQDGKLASIDVEAFISKADDVADIRTKLKEGVLSAFSIRLKPKNVEIVEDKESGEIQEFKIHEMNLLEVSVVGIPCNQKCSIDEVVGKSMADSVKNYNENIKQRTQKMADKNKKTKKKSSKKRVSQKSADNKRFEALEKGMEAMIGAVTSLTDSVKANAKTKKKKSKSKKEETPKDIDDMTGVEVMKEFLKGQRKGLTGSAEEPTTDGRPQKAFEGPTDAKSIEYAVWVMDNKVEFSKLQDSEKEIVKSTYLSAYEVANSH